ncbi:MAG: hypothetical protein KGJ86_10115 [Chloroflexota bacterium]|nr:hypothetical protein [Chloroflexota bacterium]
MLLAVPTTAEALPLWDLHPWITGMARRNYALPAGRPVLLAGFAGACQPWLRVGDVVLAGTASAELARRVGNGQQGAGSRPQATGNGQQGAGDGQQATGNGQQGAGYRKLAALLCPHLGPLPLSRERRVGLSTQHSARSTQHSALSTRLFAGRLETVGQVIGPDEKKRLGRQGVLAVDMETKWLERAAREQQVPLLAVRVIIDRLGHAAVSLSSAMAFPLAAIRLRRAVLATMELWP